MGRNDDRGIRDRDKKSFSELDKMRRERRSGQNEPSAPRTDSRKGVEGSQAYNDYKRQLHQAFDGGGLPDAIREKISDAQVGDVPVGNVNIGASSKARKAALAQLHDAQAPAELLEALSAYRAEHGFPDDPDVLGRLIDLGEDEPAIVIEALEAIAGLAVAGGVKRSGTLARRIKALQMTVDDDEILEAAKATLTRL